MKTIVLVLFIVSLGAFFCWVIAKAHQSWSKNPAASWYHTGWRTGRVFGNFWFHLAAAVFYLCVSVVVPTIALYKTKSPEAAVKWLFEEHSLPLFALEIPRLILGIAWVIILTFSLPLFIWFERVKFDDWVRNKGRFKASLTARFELNTQHMEAFWKTVAGFYVAAGLLSFSGVGKQQPEPITKDDVQALIKVFKELEAAANKTDEKSTTLVPPSQK